MLIFIVLANILQDFSETETFLTLTYKGT